MSCAPGKPCEEGKKRHIAFLALGAMAAIFFTLSAFSFLDSRGQVTPDTVSYADQGATAGKRVFQAWNCMGCHTIVGNGAYFGPDLTNIYAKAGPAWLKAFLPSAGGWPTGPAVQVHLADPAQVAATGSDDMADYLKRFPGAAERIERRGGQTTDMPNLALSAEEVDQLIAFFKYTAAMNTEGWPPKPKVDGLTFALATPMPQPVAAAVGAAGATMAVATPVDPVTRGADLVEQYGCTACHAADASKKIGPGWGGLYGSEVELADGTRVTADEDYLAESIRDANAQVVAGYAAGTMPPYASILQGEDLDAVVAYLRSLEGEGQ